MNLPSLELEHLGLGTAVIPMRGENYYQLKHMPLRAIVDAADMVRVIKPGRFIELGEKFAKKFAPLKSQDYTDAKAGTWFSEVWFQRLNSCLRNRTPMEAIQDGDEELVIHFMVCALGE